MDACKAVDEEMIELCYRLNSTKLITQLVLNEALHNIKSLITSISEMPKDAKLTKERKLAFIGVIDVNLNEVNSIINEHRQLHRYIKKVGKSIDRNFNQNYDSVMDIDIFQNKHNLYLLNKAIAQHYYREGVYDVVQTLLQETQIPVEDINPEPWSELLRIGRLILERNVLTALDWVSHYRMELEAIDSSIEFKLYSLEFIQIAMFGNQLQALLYAQKYFPPFFSKFSIEIQLLMGVLTFIPIGLSNSPYKVLTLNDMWLEVAHKFINDACKVLNISNSSYLSEIINVGCTAIPALLNYQMYQMNDESNELNELPIEIDLGEDHFYHSQFVCPILQERCDHPTNNPFKLICGHVISTKALRNLARIPQTISDIKCPYCGRVQNVNAGKIVHF